MSKLIAANWKMNNSFADIPNYVKELKKQVKGEGNIVVCVPSVMLKEFSSAARGVAHAGAQNCHYAEKGAYTGELSTKMIKDAGATYVIIGHSERREQFNEKNDLLNKKLNSALDSGLKVIFCVGEKLEEKTKYKSVLKKQIIEGFAHVKDFANIIVAYEPVWAIGTGMVATDADIDRAHKFIKSVVKEYFGAVVPVLYGGSVKPSNSKEILALPEVDGVLVGGASLKASDFASIILSR